ncbi:MAG TPA: hypothetical protein VGK36_18590 [Candidatus Angelobacter sp.]|jgi:hypothetical protein
MVLISAGKLDMISRPFAQGGRNSQILPKLNQRHFHKRWNGGLQFAIEMMFWKKEESKSKAAGKASQAAVVGVGK